ncbi:HIT domain-containing protein [bacterium]|nr:HIT domain-containing protein [bacterium]
MCPFCHPNPWEVFHTGRLVLGIWNTYPASPGHAMVITRRHVEDWFQATPEEQQEITESVEIARQAVLGKHRPDGFNVGMNCGVAAGQTVFHMHLHVLPRYRAVEPDGQGELASLVPPKMDWHLSTENLLARLLPLMERAHLIDIAVAALDGEGLDLIEAALRRMVSAGGQLRVLVGTIDRDVLSRLRGLSAQLRFVAGGLAANSYRIHDLDGQETTFVGASPITRSGLLGQSIWNYRLIHGLDREGQREVRMAFEALWEGAQT